MSIELLLIPVAIALVKTIKQGAEMRREQKAEIENQTSTQLAPLQTLFNDAALLGQTLQEHGLNINVVSENQITCTIGSVHLNYSRHSATEPFWVTVSGVQNIDHLLSEMELFENEYKHNVQSYTYNKLIENVNRSEMRISEETVLEDNSILITLDV
ncbi:MAG: hypothetical protein FWD93_03345 [Coriobacteriia bacterium]|nr:hypothetical protein [Coriobacteriia bacterium]